MKLTQNKNVLKTNKTESDQEATDSSADEGVQVKTTESQSTTYPCYKDLVNKSLIHSEMNKYGKQIVPLSLAGLYLNFTGNHLLEWIYR